MTQEEKQQAKAQLCVCGHRRSQHFGVKHLEDCCATAEGFKFCNCKKFREAQFKTEEEIEMAKEKSKKKEPKGEGRRQLLYAFDIEKARALRDEKYKGKESTVAVVLRALIATGKEEYTYDQMAAAAGVAKRSMFPMNKLKAEKVLKATKERGGEPKPKAAKPATAKKPKAARKAKKARSPKANGAAEPQATDSASAEPPETTETTEGEESPS